MRFTDQAWQQPGDPVFRDQTSLSKGRGEFGRLICKAKVCIQRENQPNSGARAVDGSNYRLVATIEIAEPPGLQGIQVFCVSR